MMINVLINTEMIIRFFVCLFVCGKYVYCMNVSVIFSSTTTANDCKLIFGLMSLLENIVINYFFITFLS